MESQLYYKRSIRVLAKALEQPNQSTDTDATPNDDKTRRSKRLAIRKDLLPEQVEAQIVDPLHFNNAIPTELFFIIMNWLEVWDQFTMRRVCRSWKGKIETMLKKFPKECLKLNVKKSLMVEPESRCVRSWEPNESIRRMQFEFSYKEPENAISEQAQISIWDKAFNTNAARLLGRVFCKVKTLIIYWDTEDCEQNIDNLVVLLSQFNEFNVLATFGLVISGKVTNRETMSKICDTLHSHMGPINQLYLMIPEIIQPSNEQRGEQEPTIQLHPTHKLPNIILFSSTFCTSGFMNIGVLLKVICFGQNLANSSGFNRLVRPLESLCFPFNGERLQDTILGALKANKDAFVSVKRLQLFSIEPREGLPKLLKYFPNLEQLSLNVIIRRRETFGPYWINALKPMTKLTELSLFNFNFERKRLRWRWDQPRPAEQVDETSHLAQLRKLTVASPYLFFYIRRESNPSGSPLIPQLIPEDIGDTIRMRFPGLQELNMWSGDAELHQTLEIHWQTLEISLNRHLPIILPQLPGLQVNIQLRHPVMYNIHLAQLAIVRPLFQKLIQDSNVYRRNANFASMNRLIELRQPPSILVHRGIDNGLLVAKAYCETMLGKMGDHHRAQEQGQQQQHNLGDCNMVEGIFNTIIRALQIQKRALPSSDRRRRRDAVKTIGDIRGIIERRRYFVAQFAREHEQAHPDQANPNEPNQN